MGECNSNINTKMNNTAELVGEFIEEQTKFYRRSVPVYARSYLRAFATWIDKKNNLITEVIEKIKVLPVDHIKSVAFISEDVGHLTGGRYYAWFLASALVEAGYDVTFYTNRRPVFEESFSKYKSPKINVIVDKAKQLEMIDVLADIYIGSPISGSIAADKLGSKYKKPAYALIFDPFPMMAKYLGNKRYLGWDNLIENLRKSDTKIINLCNTTSQYIYEWLAKNPKQVFPIYPCINSKENIERDYERQNFVVFISRIVRHKRFEDVLYAVQKCGVPLKIIASIDGEQSQVLVRRKGMQRKVEWRYAITDTEKFQLIKKAKAVISASIFEGFGLYAAEAVACGTPYVGYDYPTVREIEKYSKTDNFYFAKWKDKEDLAEKLKQCLQEQKFRKPSHKFDFDVMVDSVKDVFTTEPTIGVVTICINEGKYIGASLRSIVKHPNVKRVAVVEGADNLYPRATDDGMSVDNTKKEVLKVMAEENGQKIVFEQHGWAESKSQLRNRGLSFLQDCDYILVVDADEVYKQKDLTLLVNSFKANPTASVFRFKFYHFWKRKDLIAKGSQWDSMLFRCFKFSDKQLHWDRHEVSVVDNDGNFLDRIGTTVIVDKMRVYHYGYMKDKKAVADKLEYYSRRDRHLQVVDTFTDWKIGQPTQPTAGGGTAVKFTGTHPVEVKNLI